MPCSFNPETCLRSLKNHPVVSAMPLMIQILNSPRIVRLVQTVPDILGNWSLDEEPVSVATFWAMRAAWFSSERVRVDITSAASQTAALDSQYSAVCAFFAEAHAKEAAAARAQLAKVGAQLLCAAAMVNTPVKQEFSQLHEAQICVAQEKQDADLAALLVANGLPSGLAQRLKDCKLLIAELLNEAPYVLFLSLPKQASCSPAPGPRKTSAFTDLLDLPAFKGMASPGPKKAKPKQKRKPR